MSTLVSDSERHSLRDMIIGLDGLDYYLTTEKFREQMPVINSLEGSYGICKASILPGHEEPYTVPSWTEMYTGKLMPTFQIPSFDELYKYTLFSGYDGKVGLVTLPVTYPCAKVDGFMVSGFPVPKDRRYAKELMYPSELEEIFGSLPIRNSEIEGLCYGTMSVDELMYLENDKLNATFKCLDKYNIDMLAYGVSAIDVVMHYKPKYTKQIHSMADKIVGKLLNKLKPDRYCIVSDHGWSLKERKHRECAYYKINAGEGKYNINMKLLHDGLARHFECTTKELDMSTMVEAEEKEELLDRLRALGYKL